MDREVNTLHWKLIRLFGDLTEAPILINTSFNENEPIARMPEEALGLLPSDADEYAGDGAVCSP